MFYRFQYGHYTLEQMQNFVSADGGEENENPDGICATESAYELRRNTVYTNSDAGDAEIVVFRGQVVERIYDGVRIYPTQIVATFKPSEFHARIDEIAEEYG